MNCKPGDLAIVVRSWSGNEGKIVRCVRLAEQYLWHWNEPGRGKTFEPTWVIDRLMTNSDGKCLQLICDSQLRPIRDQPGEDEMLRIAGKPTETVREIITEIAR